MRRAEYIAALLLGLLGLATIYFSLELPYSADYGPGAGFLPLWLGIALVILSPIIHWNARTSPVENVVTDETDVVAPPALLPVDPVARRTWLIFIAGTAAVVVLFEQLGLILAIGLYMLVTMRWVARRTWLSTIAFAVLSPLVFYLLFVSFLSVALPIGPLSS